MKPNNQKSLLQNYHSKLFLIIVIYYDTIYTWCCQKTVGGWPFYMRGQLRSPLILKKRGLMRWLHILNYFSFVYSLLVLSAL